MTLFGIFLFCVNAINFTNHICLIHICMDGIMHSGLTHIKKTRKMYDIDCNNLINIRVSHSGLDYLVTDVVTFLC